MNYEGWILLFILYECVVSVPFIVWRIAGQFCPFEFRRYSVFFELDTKSKLNMLESIRRELAEKGYLDVWEEVGRYKNGKKH